MRLTQGAKARIIIQLRREGMTIPDIARRLLLTERQVTTRCVRSGVGVLGPSHRFTQKVKEEIFALRRRGKTCVEIASLYHFNAKQVSSLCLRNQVYSECVPNSVRVIELRAQKVPHKVIARQLGMSWLTTRYIVVKHNKEMRNGHVDRDDPTSSDRVQGVLR